MRWCIALILLTCAAGCGTPSLLITPVSNTSDLEEVTVGEGRGWSPGKIALIEVEGMLLNARTGGFLQPEENKVSLFTQQVTRAFSDDSVKAIILRLNSPGGTVTSADTMYQMLLRLRQRYHKPVISYTQDVAASGAYYVACGSDKIIAHPTSVIGSIGVIFETFDVEQGMAKLGIRSEAIKSGPLKDMASPFHRLSDPERAVMQGMVDEYFARFVGVVKANRPIPDAQTLEMVTDGRVFSGERAAQLGLADATGQLPDAIQLARKMGNAPGASVVMYKRPYGYGGSIYASMATPQPRADVMQLEIPGTGAFLPTGFYYLWRP